MSMEGVVILVLVAGFIPAVVVWKYLTKRHERWAAEQSKRLNKEIETLTKRNKNLERQNENLMSQVRELRQKLGQGGAEERAERQKEFHARQKEFHAMRLADVKLYREQHSEMDVEERRRLTEEQRQLAEQIVYHEQALQQLRRVGDEQGGDDPQQGN